MPACETHTLEWLMEQLSEFPTGSKVKVVHIPYLPSALGSHVIVNVYDSTGGHIWFGCLGAVENEPWAQQLIHAEGESQ